MIYLKSVLAGLAAVFLDAILFPFAFGIIAHFFQSNPSAGSPDKAIEWDLRLALDSPLFLWSFASTVVFFFGIGFWWEFRRASR